MVNCANAAPILRVALSYPSDYPKSNTRSICWSFLIVWDLASSIRRLVRLASHVLIRLQRHSVIHLFTIDVLVPQVDNA